MEVLKCDSWVDKTLISMVGLPYSGKSTEAKKMSEEHNAPIVCPDTIRIAIHGCKFIPDAEWLVWGTAKVMVKALFLAGHDTVILDATNITKARRDEWRSKKWTGVWRIMETRKEECIERAKAWKDDVILPIIEKMAEQYETDELMDSA